MISSKIKNSRGISLVSLVITTMVLVILSNVVIYNVGDSIKIESLKKMQSDIENLRDKISTYYLQNGKIPASLKYTNIENIKETGVISSAVDTGEFFVIDLSVIENLTLNYGEDFELVKGNPEIVNNYTDLYIINEESHNIFYVAGITIDNETFYTNYTSKDIDTEPVNLRYVENVKIPDGYSYVGGNKETGIIIKNNTNNKTYTWVVVNETITQVPNGIVVDNNKKSEFLDRVNRFSGYYKSDSDNTVIYIEVAESWSPIYDKQGTYKDKNEDIAYIPQGFQVSELPGENMINEGLVVMAPDHSQFVWIPVPDINTMATKVSGADSKGRQNYQGKLYNFSETTSTEKINYGQETDSYREPALLSSYDNNSSYYSNILGYNSSTAFGDEMKEEYNAMIESIIKYGGFYIGRYETSINGNSVASVVGATSMTGDSSSGNRWYEMYKKEKEYANKNAINGVTSSMVWGSQYDAMLNWALTGNDKDKVTATGNGNASSNVVNTGKTTNDKINNIYDLEGNVREWSLEANNTNYRVARGGCFNETGSPSSRTDCDPSTLLTNVGSRIVLYINIFYE